MHITDLPSELTDRLATDIVDKILEYAQDPESEPASDLDEDELFVRELERQFPDCPFYISCLRGDLTKLDRMFIQRKTVIVYDDRAEDD